MVVRKVCIIGAGVSGIVTIKTCLEDGLEPVCLEREDQLGGVWVYKDKPRDGHTEGQLYNCLITNSSKQMMNFSDFPFSRETATYIPGREVNQYYKDYAKQFDLERHIRFNTEVVAVTEADDYDVTGRWNVRSRCDGVELEEVYDAVVVCTGAVSEGKIPRYKGDDKFKGEIIHSSEFRDGRNYKGKNVLVVGGSHSAGDVAVDSSRHANQVYLSMRNGAWILPRSGPNGIPRELWANRRIHRFTPEWLLRSMVSYNIHSQINFDMYGLTSTKKLFHSEVMVNDEITARTVCGKIKIKTGMDHLTETGVVFTDGTKVDRIDALVFATGYKFSVPFVDNSIIPESIKELELYLQIFPPRLKHTTLACIGLFETIGSHAPAMELQARLVTRAFKGLYKLPPTDAMLKEVHTTKHHIEERFGKPKFTFPPVPYQERLASLIGCKPNIAKYILTDPVLAYKCVFEPCFPFSYRLEGPNQWPGARAAIMDAWDNTIFPTRGRIVEKNDGFLTKTLFGNWMKVFLTFALVLSMLLVFK